MIFNIVSGGLNIRDNGLLVSQESYYLAITNLILCILFLVMLLPKCYKMVMGKGQQTGVNMPMGMYGGMSKMFCMLFMMIVVLNVSYSILVMKYYTDKMVIDKTMYDFSMSIVVIDSLHTVKYLSSLKF